MSRQLRTRKKLHPFDRDFWTLEMVVGWIEAIRSEPPPTLEEAREVVRRCATACRSASVFQEIRLAAGTADGPWSLQPYETIRELEDAAAVERLVGYSYTGPLPECIWLAVSITTQELPFGQSLVLSIRNEYDFDDPELIEDIRFKSADVRSVFPLPATTQPNSTIKAENDCRQWLEGMMRDKDAPRLPREQALTQAQEKFEGLSQRGFGRAWDGANETTGAGWNLAGRPPKNRRA